MYILKRQSKAHFKLQRPVNYCHSEFRDARLNF